MNETTPSVYVVDDDPSVREAAGGLIRSEGMRVQTFASAQEAYARSQIEVPDCMILDVRLPGLGGLELQQLLAEAHISFPIIFLTGEGDIAMSVRAMKAGACEFLTKPFDDGYLIDAIRQGISQDRQRREILAGKKCRSEENEMRNVAGAQSERLLHGILPEAVVSELKQKGSVEPVYFEDAAVIFTDFENFSGTAVHLPPSEIVHRLHTYFSEFDSIVASHGLEKIKTIGDSYLAVAGVPEPHANPVGAACDAALEIMAASRRISGPDGWKIRVGIHTGPLVAGVIGRHKYSYDVWGATVNFASRMESAGASGRINVSTELHARVKADYVWENRGSQPIKGMNPAEMFFLLGKNS